jgi:hypothetical protein
MFSSGPPPRAGHFCCGFSACRLLHTLGQIHDEKKIGLKGNHATVTTDALKPNPHFVTYAVSLTAVTWAACRKEVAI